MGGQCKRCGGFVAKDKKRSKTTQMAKFRMVMTQMYSQWTGIPLQGLDRRVLVVVGVISDPSTKLELSIITISSVVDLNGQQKALVLEPD